MSVRREREIRELKRLMSELPDGKRQPIEEIVLSSHALNDLSDKEIGEAITMMRVIGDGGDEAD